MLREPTDNRLEQETFTCGVDIGLVNMCVAFVSNKGRIAVYHGPCIRKPGADGHEAVMNVYRYPAESELGAEQISAYKKGTKVKDMNNYHGVLNLFQGMKELGRTISASVEFQMNCQTMARLDGIIFGFFNGKGIRADYRNGSDRKRSATDLLVGLDVSSVVLPNLKARAGKSKEEDVKAPSYLFVGSKHPEFYNMVINSSIGKFDDICDSIVYAHLAKNQLQQ
jgi:hypothetical protein